MTRGIAAVLGLFASVSCGSVAVGTTDDLLAAPVSVTIDGQSVVLETFMWRDFQPIAPPDGQPLVAILRPVRPDNGASPAGVRIEAAWVIFGAETWNPAITEERFANPPAQTHYEAVLRNGPKWGPGVNVTVVVRIVDSQNRDRLLRAVNQPIGRTD